MATTKENPDAALNGVQRYAFIKARNALEGLSLQERREVLAALVSQEDEK